METSVESKRMPNFTKQEEDALLHLVQNKIGDERSGIKGTGGVPYNKVEYNDSENLVSEILGEKNLDVNTQNMIIIMITLPGGIIVSMEEAVTEEILYDAETSNIYSPEVDIFQDTVLVDNIISQSIQKNNEPIIPRKQKLNDQISTWASGKLALAQLQETQYTQQHQLKLKIMKDESEARIVRED
ncbi:hypothetical protein AGLY_002068 [Aphis glycines]|uniref:Regulatory protein zeste n=1 Tax=Aphis glycines TaxID=307491 RepID=A0A6G0U5W2_APHGL|nr:hypothetical protein AGLY_002068 [Aphis glycines]